MPSAHPVLDVLDVVKKPADVSDDVWNASRGALPPSIIEAVSPYIIGPLMFFIHGVEAYHGVIDAYEAYENEQEKQRKTKIGVGVVTTLIATTGVGLSISYFFGAIGVATVSASLMTLLPIVLPAMLGAIYTIALGKKSYILHQAYKEEAAARAEYYHYLRSGVTGSKSANEIVRNYLTARQDRIDAEKDVAAGCVEVAASILVVAGIALSILTGGTGVLALLVAGVAVGFAGKLYEYNEKHDGVISNRIRGWFGLKKTSQSEIGEAPAELKPSIKPIELPAPTETDKLIDHYVGDSGNPYSFDNFLRKRNPEKAKAPTLSFQAEVLTPNMVR